MTRRPARRAFTIIELMVVVVIIALLAALLLAGIAKVRKFAVATQVTNDISLLETSCVKFKQDSGFNPPSTFRLPVMLPPSSNPVASPAERALEDSSFLLLKRMYPRWNPPLIPMTTNIDWTAAGWSAALQAQYVNQNLNGNQSMVLLLGGPQQTGWAVDGPNPPTPTANVQKGPYFDFKPDRLVSGTGFGLSTAAVFLDPYKNPPAAPNGTPYVYFGSIEGGKYPAVSSTLTAAGCFPVMENATSGKFVNTGTVQIISAGEDGAFGINPSGGVFTAGQGVWSEGNPGADDIANFNSGSKLGVGR